jgi:peroxiredoxin
MSLQTDTPAPEFTLASSPEQSLSLSEFRGKNVVLAFYPADWSPVCSDQLAIYNEIMPMFHQYNAQLLGLSVDSRWCHQAWKRERKLKFPLLADFEPKGKVARDYDVYRSEDGTSERALYVIDREGMIRWGFVSPIDINPGAEGILDMLETLQAKEAQYELPS